MTDGLPFLLAVDAATDSESRSLAPRQLKITAEPNTRTPAPKRTATPPNERESNLMLAPESGEDCENYPKKSHENTQNGGHYADSFEGARHFGISWRDIDG
ncbi:hypothetical protein ACFW4M_34870 [Streptomyces sp. NPDC058794]|uniref:hypothetical protein n=1 Tax=unclassified Streptomyces TaxID=2593676 RepID=UPI00368CDFA5